jgi:glyoxylase-like metal-dependent hydrolase (beta-lactamase superfamily II)
MLLSASEEVAFERLGLAGGDVLQAGGLTVTAWHTPGHTFDHLAYEVRPNSAAVDLFSGGSLLFGSTGRPDLLGPEAVPLLARAQHRSARRLSALVPPGPPLYPTHGFGSFCAATTTTHLRSTVGRERAVNPALMLPEGDYVRRLLDGLGAYPAYYAHMAPINRGGPGPIDATPPARADAAELSRRLERGEWIVD